MGSSSGGLQTNNPAIVGFIMGAVSVVWLGYPVVAVTVALLGCSLASEGLSRSSRYGDPHRSLGIAAMTVSCVSAAAAVVIWVGMNVDTAYLDWTYDWEALRDAFTKA